MTPREVPPKRAAVKRRTVKALLSLSWERNRPMQAWVLGKYQFSRDDVESLTSRTIVPCTIIYKDITPRGRKAK